MQRSRRRYTRRGMLAALGAGALAGCTTGAGEDAGGERAQRPSSSPAPTTARQTASSTTTRPTETTTDATDATEPTDGDPTPEPSTYDTPTLDVTEPPEVFRPAFDKSAVVFGVRIVASERVSESQVRHAATVMAQYLDNDEDGVPDNPAVVDELVAREATLVVPYDDRELDELFGFLEATLPPSRAESIQDLHAVEILPDGLPYRASADRFDATLEEVLHLVTHVGYASVYPDVFGELPGSAIANAMDAARGGHYESIPSQYPDGAWYTYTDSTCDYGCQVTEYTYWAGTTIMGAQAVGSRPADIEHEWALSTRAAVEERDAAVFDILSDPAYGFPLVLPDGTYDPATE